MSRCEKANVDRRPEDLQAVIHDFRPVHPCAKMIAAFLDRIGYNDDEGMRFCIMDYRAAPDYFDSRCDGKRGCVRAFYRWLGPDDPRLHGGRLNYGWRLCF